MVNLLTRSTRVPVLHAFAAIGLALALGGSVVGEEASRSTAAEPETISIVLGPRHGHATPDRHGFTHCGGGNIDVAQPTTDSIVVRMTGVAVAGGHPGHDSAATIRLELEQCFEVRYDVTKLKDVTLAIRGRSTGILRSHRHGGGTAMSGLATAAVGCETQGVAAITLEPRCVSGGQNLAINDHQGPISVPIRPGRYVLRQAFIVQAAHPGKLLPCKPASAEFAPEPALDPRWISACEPFHGANKEGFGFEVTVQISGESR